MRPLLIPTVAMTAVAGVTLPLGPLIQMAAGMSIYVVSLIASRALRPAELLGLLRPEPALRERTGGPR
jgi:hypothetical protein